MSTVSYPQAYESMNAMIALFIEAEGGNATMGEARFIGWSKATLAAMMSGPLDLNAHVAEWSEKVAAEIARKVAA